MTTLNHAKELANTAVKIADKLATSQGLTNDFNTAIKIARENRITVSNIHFSLFGTPDGDEGLFTEQELAALPRVGLTETEALARGTNVPYDRYEYTNPEGKTVKASFWRIVAENHPIGLAIKREQQKIDDREKVANEYTSLTTGDAEAKKKDFTSDFTAFFGKLRTAVMCYQCMIEFSDKLNGIVNINYRMVPVVDETTKRVVMGDDGKPKLRLNRASPQIIEVEDATNTKVSKMFTMENFCRLSAEACLAGERNYGAFITSNARETPEEENPDEEKHIAVKSPKDFEDATIAALHFINAAKENSARLRALVEYFSKDDAKDRRATLFALEDTLAIITGHASVKAKYDAETTGTQQKAAA